uniref:Putative secreted protein n=1 Tax=Anopheles darlingi TaxID=43151 RepID=A0A2M4D6N6_ANODA
MFLKRTYLSLAISPVVWCLVSRRKDAFMRNHHPGRTCLDVSGMNGVRMSAAIRRRRRSSARQEAKLVLPLSGVSFWGHLSGVMA